MGEADAGWDNPKARFKWKFDLADFALIHDSRPDHDKVRWQSYEPCPHHLTPSRFDDPAHAVRTLHVLREIDQHEANKEEFVTILEE